VASTLALGQGVRVCADHLCVLTLDIPPCLDSELTEFPLRMRDWLKNVLVTLYERDEDNNLLTEKQKLRVRVFFHSVSGHLLNPELALTSGPRLAEIPSPIPRSRPPNVSPHPGSNEHLCPRLLCAAFESS